MAKRIVVTKESSTGRNLKFKLPGRSEEVSRAQLVKEIRTGKHPDHHVRVINGVSTPVSNPNGSKDDNLG